jgi:hemoglobin
MKARAVLILVPLLVAALAVACGHKKPKVVEPPPPPPVVVDAGPPVDAAPPSTLYDRLGGKDGVQAIVETFVGNVTADKRVSRFFAKVTGPKLDHFKEMLADQICEATDGGCKYTGKSMKEAHAGMGISTAQFTAVMEDFTFALEEKQVAKEDEQALFGKLDALKDDIVEKKSAPKK